MTNIPVVDRQKYMMFASNLILAGYDQKESVILINEKLGLSKRQSEKLLKRVRDEWVEGLKRKRKSSLAKHLIFRDHLYKRAYADNDIRLCLEVLKDTAKLQGLYEDRVVISKEEEIDFAGLTVDEIRKIAELIPPEEEYGKSEEENS